MGCEIFKRQREIEENETQAISGYIKNNKSNNSSIKLFNADKNKNNKNSNARSKIKARSCIIIDKLKQVKKTNTLIQQSCNLLNKNNKEAFSLHNFDIIDLIGKGAYGKVYLVKAKHDKRIYAMKVINKSIKLPRLQVYLERLCLESLNSPFILKLKCAFQDKTKLYFITDFAQGGDLFFHLNKEGRFDEEKAKFYIAELVLAIEELHSKNIIYGDLKPENILLFDDGFIKLTDFGLAKGEENINNLTNTKALWGSKEYIAPELYKGVYSKQIDWYALGVLYYKMLTGEFPYKEESNDNNSVINANNMNDDVVNDSKTNSNAKTNTNTISISSTPQSLKTLKVKEFKNTHNISKDCFDFIQQLLQVNPKKRIGYINDSEDLKKHSYFKSFDFESLEKKKLLPPFIPYFKNNLDLKFFNSESDDSLIQLKNKAFEEGVKEKQLCSKCQYEINIESKDYCNNRKDRSDSNIVNANVNRSSMNMNRSYNTIDNNISNTNELELSHRNSKSYCERCLEFAGFDYVDSGFL